MVDNHPELQQFVRQDVRRTGVPLGTGSYGDVEELCWNGTKCAGKRLHDSLTDYMPGAASSIIASKFVSECKMIAKIRHPNIVQFLGLCYFPDYKDQQRLYLMMEKLNDNLCSLLDKKPNIQLSVKCSILLDVSRGLVHLHSHTPPIVHRDLSTKNILLTASMQAKIADLGTARMISPQKLAQKLQHTPIPGTPVFMPPEAMEAKYDSKLDIFSFGQVVLHTLTQVFPCDLLAPTFQTPADKTKARTEVERRVRYLEILYTQLSKDHKLSKLTVSCLADSPKKRPTAKEVMKILEEFHLELENSGNKYNPFSRMTTIIQEDGMKAKLDGQERKEGEGEEELWETNMRTRSASFIESHILKGHPSVLKIYQQGGKFRRNAEWKEFVFKIAEGKLQYYGLNNRLQGELALAKVETAKGFWSPNSTDIFPFHVHFKGRGSPWILGAHSNEERQSWMEAIKPGSTLNQWVRPHQPSPPSLDPTHTPPPGPAPVTIHVDGTPPPLIPPRPWSPAKKNATSDDSNGRLSPKLPPRVDSLCPPTVPPRPEFTTQTSEGTYVPAHLLHMPKNVEESIAPGGEVGEDNVDDSANIYLPIIATTDDKGNSVMGRLEQEEEIVKELSSQFSPVQVDLLIQMFKTWLNPQEKEKKQQQKQRQQQLSSRIPMPSHSSTASLSVADTIEPANPLMRQHVGYAKEGQTNPYICLADIAMNLDKIQSREAGQLRSDPEEESASDRARDKRKGIYFTLTDLLDSAAKEEMDRDSEAPSSTPEKRGESTGSLDVASSLPTSRLARKNAVRSTVIKGRPRSTSEGNRGLTDLVMQGEVKRQATSMYQKPVSKLRSVLRQTGMEGMLEDSGELDCPQWSKASTEVVVPSEAPKTNRMSTYCDSTEYDIFLSRDDLVAFQQIEEGQFGPVYRANIASGSVPVPVALKPIKSLLLTETDVSKFLKEIAIMKCIHHPNIAQVYGLVDQANWIVMEYLLNGDLKNYLTYKKHSVSQLLKYMLDISMGMHYLSAKGFVHRKLAARNILVSENEVCKVADLDLGSQSSVLEEDSSSFTANIQEGLKDPNRILRWMAPEILLHRHFSTASDVWSYGVLMWEMFHPSQLPYQDCDDKVCVDRIVQGYALNVPKACPEKVAKIMKACWYQNPASRPSFLYVSSLMNSFITEYNQV